MGVGEGDKVVAGAGAIEGEVARTGIDETWDVDVDVDVDDDDGSGELEVTPVVALVACTEMGRSLALLPIDAPGSDMEAPVPDISNQTPSRKVKKKK